LPTAITLIKDYYNIPEAISRRHGADKRGGKPPLTFYFLIEILYAMILILQHEPRGPPGTVTKILDEMRVEYEVVKVYEEGLPSAPYLTGLIIMGGSMGAYDEDRNRFLLGEKEFIALVHQMGIPILGICLGGQLVAEALGGRVYTGEEKQRGWHPLPLTPEAKDDPVFKDLHDNEMVFHWHGDGFELPPGAALLAKDHYDQAFRLGRTYGVQFHPEMTQEMVDDWLRDFKGSVEERERIVEERERIVEDAGKYLDPLRELNRKILEGFLGL
jgi:GMP synthase-like glutamine amidotransferase